MPVYRNGHCSKCCTSQENASYHKGIDKSVKDTVEVTVQQQRRVTERLSLCTDPIGAPHAVRTVDTSGNKKLHFIRMVMK